MIMCKRNRRGNREIERKDEMGARKRIVRETREERLETRREKRRKRRDSE